MRVFILFISIFVVNGLFAQDCNLTLIGKILDKGSGIALPFTVVYVDEVERGAVSDDNGLFKVENLCAGDYHLEISHVGCEPEMIYVNLKRDTIIDIKLHHHTELLDEVVVHGSKDDNSAQASSTISQADIVKDGDKNLSDILEKITGVSVLKNGSGISKPVVHGLFGNRVAILNNGITQAGQQWGNDHAPEIDPFAADHLSVVKGASALAYGGNSLGSVILVESGDFENDPHLQGQVNYGFQTNGRGHTLNAKLEQNAKYLAWRMIGTVKQKGDAHTPSYFLTNTGNKEANFALQLEKEFSQRWHNKFYYSIFNTEIGVLRGSHIGNTTDLESAFLQEQPFFTTDTFSYQINAPNQKVQHHLLKLESKYFLSDEKVLNFKYGGQLNNRKEFDVRRSGRSETPALNLNQFQHFLEAVYNQNFNNDYLLKTGLQFNLVDNANLPGTGILPLIPNFLTYNPSAFLILQKENKKRFWEVGGRYDLKIYDVDAISNTTPRVIENLDHQFHNFGLSSGLKYKFSKAFKIGTNLGYMLRAPEVNELYSNGLHQGVSGIEEGNRDLNPEKSLKLVATVDWFYKKKLFAQALGYAQSVSNFIYLQPQGTRLTIRGAFPVFAYQQADATIAGLDFQVTYEPTQRLKIVNKYAMVRGQNRTDDLPLIYMPADNFSSAWQYNFKSTDRFKNPFFALSGKMVARQNRLEEGQDFLPTPDGYTLINSKIGITIPLEHSSLDFALVVDNLLNTQYRDYLNRLRYFADEQGRNFRIRVNWKFKG